MTMQEFKQKGKKLGTAGSFQNQMMSHNSSVPEVGKGATVLLYSDRHCYQVEEVSQDLKTVKVQALEAEARVKPSPIGHQDWILKPTGYFLTLVWRQNAWRSVGSEVVFTAEFIKECESKGVNFLGIWLRKNNPELAEKIYGDGPMPENVIAGITKEKKTYTKINIIFGVLDYHYDWEF